MLRRALLPLSLTALVLAGCGTPTAPSLASVAPAQIPPGWQLQNAEKYGISIGIPNGWKVGSGQVSDLKTDMANMGVDASSTAKTGDANLDNMMKGMDEENKKKEAEALAELESRGIIIRAFPTGLKPTAFETPTHFSVQILSNVAANLAGAAEAVREHVPGEEKPVAVTLPAGPAMMIHALKVMRDGGEETTSKYVLQDGKTMIVVAFVTEETGGSIIKTIEKPVVETLRIVPGKAVAPPKKD